MDSKMKNKPYRVVNTHINHLSFVDFENLDNALNHYFKGLKRGYSYTLIVFEDGARELEKLIPNSKPCVSK